ncbi:low molecular weight protein arginine phosphatase [Bacillaceae bacterium SIJ1]|nr:low molecular weight protein arginine phosphatase [Litoribacterium kuwaitense]
MAEAVFNHKSKEHFAKSAGVSAYPGAAINEKSAFVLKKKGVSVQHSSQPLTKKLVDWADLILTMERAHKWMVTSSYPEVVGSVFTLKEFASGAFSQWSKLDTLNAEKAALQAVGERIPESLENEIQKLEKQLADVQYHDIHDPFGSSVETYEKTYDEIERSIDETLHQLDNNRGEAHIDDDL